MSDVTRILAAIEQGDTEAAEQLLPLVYDELRRLAAWKLAHEKPGQTLQATALVHEAYIRLVDTEKAGHWDSRGHFFAAAAEAMRRILVDSARRKRSLREGGQLRRQHADFSTFVRHICQCDLLFEPGTRVRYQSMGTAMVGEIVERISGMPLREFCAKEIFAPLGMEGTSLGIRDDLLPELAPVCLLPVCLF